MAGEQYFTSGKYPEAQAQFERFTKEFVGNPFTPQAVFGRASALEAQGKTEEAARAYKEVADRYPAAAVAPQAKFALGRIFESQSKWTEARSAYEEILRTYQNSSLREEAAIRAEELRAKLPPPPAVAVPSAAPGVPAFQTTITNLPPANPPTTPPSTPKP